MKKLIIITVAAFISLFVNAQTQPVGTGINAIVRDFATDGTNLLIANDSLNGGGYMVREWNGTSYSTFATPNISPKPSKANAVSYFNGQGFASFSNSTGNSISKLGDTVYATTNTLNSDLASDGSNLYVVGTGTLNYYRPTSGTINPTNGRVSFDGSTWNTISSSTNVAANTFKKVKMIGASIYSLGNFTMNSGATTNVPVIKLNAGSFSAPYGNNNIVTNSGQYVSDMEMYNSEMYASGSFASQNTLEKWNGSSWVTIGAPLMSSNSINAIATFDNKLWAGGTVAGNPNAGYLAYYNGSTWTSVSGFNGPVYALQVVGNNLFIGGNFSAPQNHIAQIEAAPTASFSTSNTICAGSCITFTNTSVGASTYTWTFSGGSPASSFTANPGTVCFANSGTYTISLVVSNSSGSDTSIISLTVNSLPTVIAGAPITVNAGSSVTLTGSGTAISYAWSGGVTDGVGFVPSATGTYTVTGTNANGCTATDSVKVTVLTATGIQELNTNKITAYVYDNVLYFMSDKVEGVRLFDIFGRMVYAAETNNLMLTVNPGVYVLSTPNHNIKLIAR